MTARVHLDLDVLRTFVTGFELGSFARAADRLGRSQSAVSTQLRRLEEQLGRKLVQRAGRGLTPTLAGEMLLGHARRLLELNDAAVAGVRGSDVAGWARLGLPQDLAESRLPPVLARFARAHPQVRVEVRVDRAAPLAESVRRGELDLALVWNEGVDAPYSEPVAEMPIVWVGPEDWPGVASLRGEAVPLAAFAPPCAFRAAATAALDRAGIGWRIAFMSPSLSGLWAASASGLGITARTDLGVPAGLAVLDAASCGLPALPRIRLALHRAERDPADAVASLAALLRDAVSHRR